MIADAGADAGVEEDNNVVDGEVGEHSDAGVGDHCSSGDCCDARILASYPYLCLPCCRLSSPLSVWTIK